MAPGKRSLRVYRRLPVLMMSMVPRAVMPIVMVAVVMPMVVVPTGPVVMSIIVVIAVVLGRLEVALACGRLRTRSR